MPTGAEFVNKHRVKYVENVNIYKNDLECNLNSERNEQADEKDEESKVPDLAKNKISITAN